MKRLRTGLLAMLMAGAVSACGAGVQTGTESSTPSAPLFDYDWSVQRVGGGEVELGALEGRVLIVNFWASWCPPCVRELDSFERLAMEVEAAGVDATFLFVSPEELRVAEGFVDRHGWALPFAVEVRRAPSTLGDLVLPTTFVVAPDGRVALRHRGATDWDRPEVLELLGALDSGRGGGE